MIATTLHRQQEGWTIEMVDIEAAFLNAELEGDRPVYAEWPEGIVELGFITEEERRTTCIKLKRPMYGGIDVPRLFMKTLSRYLINEMKMSQSVVDPCLYYWKDSSGDTTLLAVTHVDDVALAGTADSIAKFKTELKKRFTISDMGRLKKHLGVWYDWHVDSKGELFIMASMTKLEDEIIQAYEKATGIIPKCAPTPGFPRQHLTKNTDGETIMIDQYRSLVGKIMYLSTKLAPDITNAARELSQHMSNPGDSHWRAMGRMVRYIKARHYQGLIYRKPKELHPISMVDSDYAENTDHRRSKSSGIHALGGTLLNGNRKHNMS
jgi:hypothetical protein